MMRVLAVDVGSTQTVVGLFEGSSDAELALARKERFENASFSGLLPVLGEFLHGERVDAAGVGVPGPVVEGRCQTTHLPWVVTHADLVAVCGTSHVALRNDVESAVMGVPSVPEESLVWLQRRPLDPEGIVSLLSVGTGFGRAYWAPYPKECRLRGRAFATESGHTTFAPRNVIERRLLEFLSARHEHVTVEHALSSPGLHALYQFVVQSGLAAARCQLEIDRAEDPSAQICHLGTRDLDEASAAAVALFVDILGAELGNVALETIPRGGLFITGRVVQKLKSTLKKGELLDAFRDKDRMGELLDTIPIALLDEPDLTLLGAREAALATMRG